MQIVDGQYQAKISTVFASTKEGVRGQGSGFRGQRAGNGKYQITVKSFRQEKMDAN